MSGRMPQCHAFEHWHGVAPVQPVTANTHRTSLQRMPVASHVGSQPAADYLSASRRARSTAMSQHSMPFTLHFAGGGRQADAGGLQYGTLRITDGDVYRGQADPE
eukprot:5043674-Lingulodinium_polyedra.AAC.1